jgi:drug/metabolite transporter (DMT)-like permease
MTRSGGYLMVLGAAASWGVAATGAKALLNQDLHPFFLAQARVTISWSLLAAGLAITRPERLRVHPRCLWRLALLGIVGMAGANVTYYVTMRESSVATGILLQYAAPLLVMLYALISREERLTAARTIAGLLAVGGCYFALGGWSPAGVSAFALVMGILSAFCFGFLTVFARHADRGLDTLTVTFYAIGFAALFWAVELAVTPRRIPSLSLATWGALVVLAVFSILIPYLLYFAGLKRIGPTQAIVCATLEPIVAIGSAAVFLGERLDPPQIAGATVVLAAITGLQLARGGPAEEAPR